MEAKQTFHFLELKPGLFHLNVLIRYLNLKSRIVTLSSWSQKLEKFPTGQSNKIKAGIKKKKKKATRDKILLL